MRQTRAAGDGGKEIDRNEIHEVEEKHPAEDSESKRRDQTARALKGILHLRICQLNDELDEVLELGGYHACAALGPLTRGDVESSAEEDCESDGEEHTVPMDDREIDDAVRVLVRQKAQVV